MRLTPIPADMRGRQARAARILLGMSQQELAEACGVNTSTIGHIENETGDPRRSSIYQVEDYLISRGVRFVSDPLVVGMPTAKDWPDATE